MFDWIAKLFGGDNSQKGSSPAPRPQTQPQRGSGFDLSGFNRPADNSAELARQAEEEERRRREQERREREAAERARKVKEQAEANAKQIQEQQDKQAEQAKKTTLTVAAPDNRTLSVAKPSKRRISVSNNSRLAQATEREQRIREEGRIGLDDVAAGTGKAVGQVGNWLFDNVVGGGIDWLGQTASRVAETGDQAATLAVRSLQNLDPNRTEAQKSAAINYDSRRFKGYADDRAKFSEDIDRLFGDGIGTNAEYDREAKNISQGKADAGELFSAVTKSFGVEGLAAGLLGRQTAKAAGRQLDGAVDDTVLGTQKTIGRNADNFFRQAEQEVAQETEQAIGRLPDPVMIERQAVEAGKIDDGIVSPSRTEQVKSNLTQEVERQRAEIESNYQTTVMGLDEIRDVMTPRPLATELAGGPVDPGMAPQRVELDAPEIIPEQFPELDVPLKTPTAQPIDTPNQEASKAAANATPVPPPQPVVKTRTIDDMSDEEVVQRFGKTREEIQASRAELEAEKAQKAERAKAKEDRKAQKAAALEQAALDAGEAPAKKDIFAGKKRTVNMDELSKKVEQNKQADLANAYETPKNERTKAEKKLIKDAEAKPSKKDIFAGKKRDEFGESVMNKGTYELPEAKGSASSLSRHLKGDDTPSKTSAKKDLFAGKKRSDASSEGPEFKASKENVSFMRGSNGYSRVMADITGKDGNTIKMSIGSVRKGNDGKWGDYSIGYKFNTRNEAAQAMVEKYNSPRKPLEVNGSTTLVKGEDGKLVAPTKQAPANKSKDLEEHADIDPQTNMPKEDLKPMTEWADEYNGKKPADVDETRANEAAAAVEAPSKSKDIFAGKKRTTEPAETAPAKKAPAKTAPKGEVVETSDIDTDYILKKADTGEKTRSQSRTSSGAQTRADNERRSRKVVGDEAAIYAKNVPVDDFATYAAKKKTLTAADEQIAQAYINAGRVKGNKIMKARLEDIKRRAKQETATDMGTFYRYDRAKATSDEITANYEERFSNKDLEVDDADIEELDRLAVDYTAKRDLANQLREKAIGSKSSKDIDELEKALNDAYIADRTQKAAAYDAALKAARKAEKEGQPLSEEQFAELSKLKKDIGVFQYDAVDSSLLSATGTMFNNFMNGIFGLTESVALGKVSSRIAGKVHGVKVGGYSTKGLAMGAKEGARSIGTEVSARTVGNRAGGAGPMKKLWGAYKNTVTTANELSEVNIRARIQGKTYDHYMQVNKEAGLKGKELKNQSRIDALTDPLEVRQHYEAEAYLTQGMSALEKSGGKERIESKFKDWIKDGLIKNTAMGSTMKGRDTAEYASKLASRFLLGFPSVVWRSGVVAGAKRTPAIGLIIDGTRYAKASGPEAKARIMAEAIEHAGSAATYTGVGMFLGASGIVTGAYPTDPNEQKRWQAEGKTEWSIKIGNDFYDIRKSLGAFALPVMMAAQVGQNMAEGEHPLAGFIPTGAENPSGITRSPLVAILGVTPVDGPLARVNEIVEVMEGKSGWADLAATGTRMTIPAAGFINELAKMTTAAVSGKELEARDKDNQVQEFLNRLAVAIPGGGEVFGLEAKQTLGVDQTATSIIGRLFGAQKGYNPEGAAVVQAQRDDAAKASVSTRSVDQDTFDKVLSTMDPDTQGLYKRLVNDGKTLPPEKQTKVDKAIAGLAKGEYYESKFGDEGDWDTQAYILGKKYDMWQADPSRKKEDVEKLDREVRRTAILNQTNGDPKLYKKYKEISQSELKKMFDDESEEYDLETAEMLVAMDEMFTKHGLSYKTSGDNPWTKRKYDIDAIKKYLKGRGGGGGSGGKGIATNVSGLKLMESEGLGEIKYKTVSGMPNLMAATPRKNFKKSISIKRGVQL